MPLSFWVPAPTTATLKNTVPEEAAECVSAGSNSLFFLFSRELPFPLSLRWQVYLKPAATPPLVLTALQVSRNKKLTSGTGRGEMDILLLDCPSVLFKLFQPPSRRLPLSLPSSLPPSLRAAVFVSEQVTSLTPRQAREAKRSPGPPSRRRRPFKSLLMEQY